MLLDGGPVSFASPAAANAAGITCIFQELSLIPDLSVADNIAISNPPRRFVQVRFACLRHYRESAPWHRPQRYCKSRRIALPINRTRRMRTSFTLRLGC